MRVKDAVYYLEAHDSSGFRRDWRETSPNDGVERAVMERRHCIVSRVDVGAFRVWRR